MLSELAMAHKYKELTEFFSSFSRNLKTGHLSPDSSVNWVKLQNWDFSRDSAADPEPEEVLPPQSIKSCHQPRTPQGQLASGASPWAAREAAPWQRLALGHQQEAKPMNWEPGQAVAISPPSLQPLISGGAQTSIWQLSGNLPCTSS